MIYLVFNCLNYYNIEEKKQRWPEEQSHEERESVCVYSAQLGKELCVQKAQLNIKKVYYLPPIHEPSNTPLSKTLYSQMQSRLSLRTRTPTSLLLYNSPQQSPSIYLLV